ncbi:MAG TPA: hypothetical protein VHL34_20360 [Rhizomicrobium sp.]|jgi:hypothetical protein|nr:hypothetical protein [Rhizomicrobium sp.]
MQLDFNIAGFNRESLRENGPGFAASAALHLLLLLFVLWFLSHPAKVRETVTKVFPVDIVHLGDKTELPSADVKKPAPKLASPQRGETTSPAPATVSPNAAKPLPDDAFDAKLRALAQLRQPDAKLKPLDNAGTDATTTGDTGGSHATYSLRDFVRAQVLRHWNLDYSILGDRHLSVSIRVSMSSAGVIVSSDIVDMSRYQTDAVFREVALSARNAVTLSSPIPLPPGSYPAMQTFVIALDPRDTNR